MIPVDTRHCTQIERLWYRDPMNVEDGIAPTSTPRFDAHDADLRHRVDPHDWQAAIRTERTTTLLIFRHGHFMLEA